MLEQGREKRSKHAAVCCIDVGVGTGMLQGVLQCSATLLRSYISVIAHNFLRDSTAYCAMCDNYKQVPGYKGPSPVKNSTASAP
jgi:hypothetical protein